MTGTWTPLTNLPAQPLGIGTMILLSDGTVMAEGGGITNTWFKLTPDATGSYVNGTWSSLAPMSTPRLFFGSNVLPSGKVMVLGGEDTDLGAVATNTGEIYDPVSDTWTPMTSFPQSRFGDDPTALLANGQVLGGYIGGPQTYLFDPSNNGWAQGGTKLRGDRSDEETWVELPDGSILSYDVWASSPTGTGSAQRYIPATNTWADAGVVPAPLSVSAELGPAFLLPDGRVFQIGANGNTALYTPSTNSWASGPTLPIPKGADDAPGAELPNGHVLFAADTPVFHGPTQLFDFDPIANTITPLSNLPAGLVQQLAGSSSTDRMLVLPTGQVALTTGANQLWIYTPDGLPSDAWRPTVASVTTDGSGTYTLTGTQLTGLSEGASYGDDAEMSTNYPIVQLTSSAGQVIDGRTTDWTPGVATGATVTSVQFTLPAGLPAGSYTLRAIANGIASSPVAFNVGAAQGFAVTSVTPDRGAVLTAPPTQFVLEFNEPVQAATLQAGDLTVNGIGANSVVLDSTGRMATFSFNASPVVNQGVQTIAVAAGAITGQDGTGLLTFSSSFRDDLALTVTSTSPAVGGIITTTNGNATIDVSTNEPIDPATADTGNVILSRGTVTSATVLPGNTTIQYTLTGVSSETPLAVTIVGGQLKDQLDSPFSREFSATYQVDLTTASLGAPLTPLGPAGSLIAGADTSGSVSFAGDTDSYTLTVGAGQLITAAVAAGDPGLQPTVAIVDPSGTTVATASAAAGQTALIQTFGTSVAGTYTVVVGGSSGTVGNYRLQVRLNAALENEGNVSGATNDTPATAQDLNSTFLTLQTPVSQAARGAVLGTADLTGAPDYYSFTVSTPHTVTVALNNLSPSGSLSLDLVDTDGTTVLASGVAASATPGKTIANFGLTVAGTYFIRVTSNFGVPYSLLTLQDAALDNGLNSLSTAPQDITDTHGVLGEVGVNVLEQYQVTLGPNQTELQLQTSTPSDGSGTSVNLLEPLIELSGNGQSFVGTPLADGRNESLTATGLAPSTTYTILVLSRNFTSGDYFLSMTPNQGAPADIVQDSFRASAGLTATVTYTVTGTSVSPFRIGLYTSAGSALDTTDSLIGTIPRNDQAMLTPGVHTVTVGIGTGTGLIALPGAGLALPAGGYNLLAVANDDGAATETSQVNDIVSFFGAYHAPGGNVIVHGSDGSDTISVASAGGALNLDYDGNSASFTAADVAAFDFYVHGGNDSVDAAGIGKPMQFFAGSGTDSLIGGGVLNTLIGPDQPNTWVLTGSNAGTLNGGSFSNFANLSGGALNDTFTIRSGASLAGTLDGRGGLNTLDYSSFGSTVAVNLATQTANALSKPWANLGAVIGSTAVNTLTAADTANTWAIGGTNAGTVNGFAFTAFQNLNGGAGSDAFGFTNGGSIAGSIDGKAGANALNYSARGSAATVNLQTRTATGITGTWANIQSATGTGTTDTLIGANSTNTWSITGLNTGSINGAFGFTGFVNLTGGTAPDTFQFHDGAGVTGVIDGQGSTNALDYSAYTTGVYVNLLTAAATGTAGVANIANVTGGQGNDILVGDNNPNVFVETAGRNLMIGEGGKDTLTAGSGGDILIGGRTAYDTNVAALDAILATWSRTDLSYGARTTALQSGVSYVASTGTQIAALTASNVFDDAASDILNGGSGQDWFFAHVGSNSDTINKEQAGESVTGI